MRLKISFKGEEDVNLPLSYNQTVQGFIYNNISDKFLRTFMHDEGFAYNKRVFKLFSFSRVEGAYVIDNKRKRIIFSDEFTLQITSMFPAFIQDFVTTIIKNNNIKLGTNVVKCVSVSMEEPEVNNKMRVKTLSPIVVYSTLENEKKKYTYYYHPGEKLYGDMIRDNLLRKLKVFNPVCLDTKFNIVPVSFKKDKPNTVHYKGFIIKGWSGIFDIEGDKTLMEIAYNYGLGSKNSMGFGMIEEIS